MQEEMRKSLEDGSEPDGRQPPMKQHAHRPVYLRKILWTSMKSSAKVINLKEENVTLKSTISGFQDQLTNITRQLATQQRQ